MAGSAPKTSVRKRKSESPAPAPSRIRNKKQQQIVDMVSGYESIISYTAAVSAIQYIWAALGVVVIGLGLGTLLLGGSETAASLLRTHQAMGYGMALLTGITLLATMVLGAQATFNVAKIGRTPSIGQVGIVGRHLPGLAVGIGLLVAAGSLPEYESTLQLFGGLALIWGLMVPAGLVAGVLQMLWRTSALGDPADEPSNRDFTMWFVGMLMFAYGSVGVETLADLSQAATGFLVLLAGIGITLAATSALRFLPQLADRQEARVVAVLESFSDDEPSAQPVTAQQIEDAWEASSDRKSVV